MKKISKKIENSFFETLGEEGWAYLKTSVDVVEESVLILNKDLKVMAANAAFYKTFKVTPENTVDRVVYKLGTGQWNSLTLRKLLEDILPQGTFFKGFEVTYDFPDIGRKIMILNARQVYFDNNDEITHEFLSPIILLVIEDVTEMVVVADTLAGYSNQLEGKLAKLTEKLEDHIEKLEKEITRLRTKPVKTLD